MNGKSKRRGRRTSRKRLRNKKTAYQKWLRFLEKNYGAYNQPTSIGTKQMVCVYGQSIPPRMPAPGGPSPGATMTTTQFVRGSDMTLPTGSAIVGALVRQSGSTDIFAAFAFCLADIPNITAVSSLFDQYRIEEIHFRLRTKNPGLVLENQASPNYGGCSPLLIIDRDDATAPTTLSELQQYDNCVEFSAQDNCDVILEPSITPSVFSGGAFSGYGVQDSRTRWLDVANTSIPHYGVKIGMPALVATTTQKFDWDVEAIYKVSFLSVR